jgi:drug/metabolite transporter (DMT)-like permease
MYPNSSTGIGAGVLAGVFWGTPFLVPLVLSMFTSIEVAFGRFVFFGLASLVFLPHAIKAVRHFTLQDFIHLLTLSAGGFWLYTIILFYGVQLTNGVISALIIGLLPVSITLFSKPMFNIRLCLGLLLIIIGMGFLLVVPLMDAQVFKITMAHVHIHGLLFLLLALGMWTWFALSNAKFLTKHTEMKPLGYSSLMGIISVVCILPIFMLTDGLHNIVASAYLPSFLIWAAVLGIGASWIANVFWAYCCKTCSPSVYGPLIVSETVFGLIYSFIFQHRLPYGNELLAIILLIIGVIMAIRSQR